MNSFLDDFEFDFDAPTANADEDSSTAQDSVKQQARSAMTPYVFPDNFSGVYFSFPIPSDEDKAQNRWAQWRVMRFNQSGALETSWRSDVESPDDPATGALEFLKSATGAKDSRALIYKNSVWGRPIYELRKQRELEARALGRTRVEFSVAQQSDAWDGSKTTIRLVIYDMHSNRSVDSYTASSLLEAWTVLRKFEDAGLEVSASLEARIYQVFYRPDMSEVQRTQAAKYVGKWWKQSRTGHEFLRDTDGRFRWWYKRELEDRLNPESESVKNTQDALTYAYPAEGFDGSLPSRQWRVLSASEAEEEGLRLEDGWPVYVWYTWPWATFRKMRRCVEIIGGQQLPWYEGLRPDEYDYDNGQTRSYMRYALPPEVAAEVHDA